MVYPTEILQKHYLSFLQIVKISHLVSIWNWIQKYKPQKLREEEEEYRGIYCIQKDETAIKAGSELIWLWIAIIKPKGRKILLSISISKERKICLLYPNVFYLVL